EGVRTIYTRDADGRILTQSRQGTDGSTILVESSSCDLAGRRVSVTDARNRTTSFSETRDASGRTVRTTTYPGGDTRIETWHKDGRLYTVAGSAARPLKYLYGRD